MEVEICCSLVEPNTCVLGVEYIYIHTHYLSIYIHMQVYMFSYNMRTKALTSLTPAKARCLTRECLPSPKLHHDAPNNVAILRGIPPSSFGLDTAKHPGAELDNVHRQPPMEQNDAHSHRQTEIR